MNTNKIYIKYSSITVTFGTVMRLNVTEIKHTLNSLSILQNNIREFALNYPQLNLSNGKIITNNHSCYYIESGCLRFFVPTTCGHEFTAHIFNPGALFPIITLYSDTLNHFRLQALADTKLRVIPVEAVKNFISHDSAISTHFLSRISHGTSKMILRLGQAYFCSARDRVISIIFLLHNSFGCTEGGDSTSGCTLNKKMSHEQLASMAGLTRETCSRELEKLKQDGLIKLNYKQITILKLDKLIEIAKEHNLTADMLSAFPEEINEL